MKCIKEHAVLYFLIIGASFDIQADAFGSATWIAPQKNMMITRHNIVPTLRHEQPLLTRRRTKHFMSEEEGSSSSANEQIPPAEMKLRDIQAELKEMGVSYADCFDRESLMRRLEEARRGEHTTTTESDTMEAEVDSNKKEKASDTTSTNEEKAAESSTPPPPPPKSEPPPPPSKEFDREATLTELRSLRVAELRSRLASRQIRWANMIEKEDLVQALCNAMQVSSKFSLSGALTPGECTDINSDQLTTELSSNAGTPLLLDVYATWCGPCKMMAPQMKMAAADMGETCRVAKIDSDLNQQWSAKLRVEGLPTVIVFDENGVEVGRREGLLMKSNLIDLVERSTGMK